MYTVYTHNPYQFPISYNVRHTYPPISESLQIVDKMHSALMGDIIYILYLMEDTNRVMESRITSGGSLQTAHKR